jgi:DNA-binding NtrC family response regulator
MATILIVDDEFVLVHELSVALRSGGHEVRTAGTAGEALAEVEREPVDLVLLDLRLPDRSGLELIKELHEVDSSTLIVLMTAYGSVRDSVEAIRLGAADFLAKPLDLSELGLLIERLLRQQRQERELAYWRCRDSEGTDAPIGRDPHIAEILRQVERLCDAGLPAARRPAILLTGESGVGKGFLARAIHGRLGGGAFIEVACAERDLDAELFGYERGSFSGANMSRPGLLEAAEGGCVLLDEVGELPLDIQAKVLSLLEEHCSRRVGSVREREVDAHVLASTRQDLDALAETGSFRPDLLQRLRVLSFRIPPLRERPEDIRLLARHFAREFSSRYGEGPLGLEPDAEEILLRYPWPGNVRELSVVIERAILVNPGARIDASVFADLADVKERWSPPGRVRLPEDGVSLDDVERDLLQQALERAGGNQTRASALLGLSRDTFRYRIAKWGLDPRANETREPPRGRPGPPAA